MHDSFIKDRNKALFSLDEKKIRAFTTKYKIDASENPVVFWASVYKSILEIKNSPEHLRKKAECWLDSHGFQRGVCSIPKQDLPIEQVERYQFEHVIFPTEFYNWGDKLLNQVIDGGRNYMADLYTHVEAPKHALVSYAPKNFNVMKRVYPCAEGTKVIVRLDLPQPIRPLECRRIYLCRNEHNGDCMYFTSELSMQGTYFLCAWTKKHTHMLLSMQPLTNEFEEVVRLFSELSHFEPSIGEVV